MAHENTEQPLLSRCAFHPDAHGVVGIVGAGPQVRKALVRIAVLLIAAPTNNIRRNVSARTIMKLSLMSSGEWNVGFLFAILIKD